MKIIVLLSVLLCLTSALNPIVSKKDFANGFLHGMRATKDVTDADACIQDLEVNVPKIEDALKKIQSKNPILMLEAAKEIYDAQQALLTPSSECQKSLTEGKTWYQDVELAFTDSQKRRDGMINLFKNVKNVVEDVQEFLSQIGVDDYQSGFKLGDILGIYIYGAAQKTFKSKFQEVNSKDFAIGFLTGLRATDDVVHGYSCVSDVTEIIPKIQDAVDKIKSKNIEQIIQAVQEIIESSQSLVDPSGNCQQSLIEGKAWGEAVEQAFTDSQKRITGLLNLAKNIETVYQDVEAFQSNFGTNDFLAGDKLGDIFGIYVFGPAQQQVLLTLGDTPIPFTDCQNGPSTIKLTGINITSAPVKGQKSVMTVSGSATDHVELKEVKYNAKLGGVSIHSEAIADQDILESGDSFSFQYNVLIPSIAPSGQYELQFNVNNMDGKSVACFDVKVSL